MKRTEDSLDAKQVLSVIEKYSTAWDTVLAQDLNPLEYAVIFVSIFVSPLLDIQEMTKLFQLIKENPGTILAADMTRARNGEKLNNSL